MVHRRATSAKVGNNSRFSRARGNLAPAFPPNNCKLLLVAGQLALFRVVPIEQGVKNMFLTLFIILLLAWILGFTVFHVTSFLIHVLLIVAVIALIMHFVRPRSTVA